MVFPKRKFKIKTSPFHEKVVISVEKLRRLLFPFKQPHVSTTLPSLNVSKDEAKLEIAEKNVKKLATPGLPISKLNLHIYFYM